MTRPAPTAHRALRALAGALAAALLVAGCSDGGSGGGGGGDVATVVIWDRAGAQATIRQQHFEEWNAGPGAEQGVRVQYEPQAADRYEELVRTAFQTDRAPDIFHSPSSQLGGFVAAGWVQPLTGVVDQQVLDDAAAYLEPDSELVWGGEPYAVPTTAFTNRLLINRELFEAAGLDPEDPPATLGELEEAAAAIAATEPGEVYGIGLPGAWVGFRQWIVDLPVMAADPELTNGLFNQVSGSYQTADYAEVVETYRTMVAEESAYPGTTTTDQDVTWTAFAQGEIGMIVTSGAVVAAMTQLDSTVDAVAVPLPVPDGATLARSPMNAGYPYAIASTTEEPEAAAIAFAEMVGPDLQVALAEGDAPPLSEAVWDSPEMAEKELLLSFRPGPTDEQWPKNPNSVVPVEGESADDTIARLLVEPEEPVEPALASLQERYQTAYDQAVADGELDPAEFTR